MAVNLNTETKNMKLSDDLSYGVAVSWINEPGMMSAVRLSASRIGEEKVYGCPMRCWMVPDGTSPLDMGLTLKQLRELLCDMEAKGCRHNGEGRDIRWTEVDKNVPVGAEYGVMTFDDVLQGPNLMLAYIDKLVKAGVPFRELATNTIAKVGDSGNRTRMKRLRGYKMDDAEKREIYDYQTRKMTEGYGGF